MDLMDSEIYCTYNNEKVNVKDCMDCMFLYDCDNNWCDNHQCKDICEYKKNNECSGMI